MTRVSLFIAALFFLISGCRAALPEADSTEVHSQVVNSNSPAYYYFAAAQLKLNEGDLNEAIWLVKQALHYDSGSLYLKLEMANLLLMKKQINPALKLIEQILSIAPENVQALSLAGQIYQQQGDMDRAVAAFEKVIHLQPAEQNSYLLAGRIYWNRNDLNNAERVFRQMTEQIPHSYAAFYFYGKVLAAQGKTDAAEGALLKSLEIEPGIEEPLMDLLHIYQGQNQSRKITEIYKTLLRLNPQNHQAAFGLAQHYHQNDQDALSLDILKQLGDAAQHDSKVIPTLFEIYLEKKQYASAVWALEGMLQAAPENPELHYMAGIAYDGIENSDKAIEHLLQVPPESRFFDNAVVHSALLFNDKGEIERAIEVVEKALVHSPDHVDYYLYLGSFHEALGRFEDALKILKEGIRRDSKNARLYFRLGVVLDKTGQRQESIAAMKNVLALTPDDAEALNYLGYTYADLGIHLDEAESMIRDALALKPDDGYITDSLGWLYFQKGQYDHALEWLLKAVERVPEDPTILEHLGDVYHKMGRKDTALEYYRRSLKKKEKGRDLLEEKIRQRYGN